MGSSQVQGMLPWVAVLAILLFNPIGLMSIPPAVAPLLSFLNIAYAFALVVVLRHVPAMWSSGRGRQETKQTEDPAAVSSQREPATTAASSQQLLLAAAAPAAAAERSQQQTASSRQQ